MIRCDICGKEYEPGYRPDGVPVIVEAIADDDSVTPICSYCIDKKAEEMGAGVDWSKYIKQEDKA